MCSQNSVFWIIFFYPLSSLYFHSMTKKITKPCYCKNNLNKNRILINDSFYSGLNIVFTTLICTVYQFYLYLSLYLCCSIFVSHRFTKARKHDIKVVQNVILEVDKQHMFNIVTIATAHSRKEQSHTLKNNTHTHAHLETYVLDIA